MLRILPVLVAILVASFAEAAPIERIWLSHEEETPVSLTVSWEAEKASVGVIAYGDSPELGKEVRTEGTGTRHRLKLPFEPGEGRLYYRVGEGDQVSAVHSVKRYSSSEFRMVVVGDWGFVPGRDLSAISRDDPHLLLTAGDNVPSLHQAGLEGTRAFAALIDAHLELFHSYPFLPILGNHDREITPRGPKPPDHPVYDVEATAFREFFALPGEEWKWRFEVPSFGIALVALDLNHIQDFGTTWQTCHPWQSGSDQFRWYESTMKDWSDRFVVTLMNEKRTALEAAGRGLWLENLAKGDVLVTGFGYFAERSELPGGLPCFNTCLKGNGAVYPDPLSRFLASEDNYLLFTFAPADAPVVATLKRLDGSVLDEVEIPRHREGPR